MDEFSVGEVVILNRGLGIDDSLIGTRAKIIRKRTNIFGGTEYTVKCVGKEYGTFNQWIAETSWLIKIN